MEFASDNTSGATPEVLAAVVAANAGYAASYGADQWTEAAQEAVRKAFEAPQAAVHLVATGTAANALSAAILCPPWGAIYSHEAAHVEVDECGAPEFYIGGGKLVLTAGTHGKITPEGLAARLARTPQGDVHHIQHGMLSLTNLTEAGTAYRPAEVAALAALALKAGIGVHMDGARFANALAATGATPAEMTWKAGVDVLSFGASKNGAMAVEAVVIFDPAKSWEFELRRKRAGHLFSKSRFLGAQMGAYLQDGGWLAHAAQANRMGQRLANGLAALPGGRLIHPADGNIVFAAFPRALHVRATAAGAHYYLWPFDQTLEGPGEEEVTARFVCSWSTTEADVDRLLEVLAG